MIGPQAGLSPRRPKTSLPPSAVAPPSAPTAAGSSVSGLTFAVSVVLLFDKLAASFSLCLF